MGGSTRFFAALAAAFLVTSSLGTAWTARTTSFHAHVDPSLRAGEIALVHTTSGLADALSIKLIRLGASDVQTYGAADTVVARLSDGALDAIRHDPSVTVATSDGEIVALDNGRGSGYERGPDIEGTDVPPSYTAINAPRAWTKTTGEGSTVAIMDTGVARLPDLRDSVKQRLDFVRDGANTDDPAGHGTFIAGLIAANGTMKGVAPDARLISLRVLDANGVGRISMVVAAFDWVLSNRNIDVLNISWGAKQTDSYHNDALSALVEAVWASGVTVVAAAGNQGPASGTITTPGSDPFVVTAGAFDDHDSANTADDSLAPFSSRGPTKDNVTKPDTLAPGVHILSLRVPGLVYLDRDGQPVGVATDRYIHMTGTSASAALTSGVAALVASQRRHFTPNQTKGAIVASGRAILGTGTTGVDAARALTVAPAAVNVGLAPSHLLLSLLASSHQLKVHGVSWEGTTWEGVTWESVSWETVTWESVTWEGATWQGVTWETLTQ